jgi:hypothetical protein
MVSFKRLKETSVVLDGIAYLYRSIATRVSQLKICDFFFSGETFKGFEVL